MNCIVCGRPIDSVPHPPTLSKKFCTYQCMGRLGRETQMANAVQESEQQLQLVRVESPAKSGAPTMLSSAGNQLILARIGAHFRDIADLYCDLAAGHTARNDHGTAPAELSATPETEQGSAAPQPTNKLLDGKRGIRWNGSPKGLNDILASWGRTHERLAAAWGVSPTALSNWRTGQKRPSDTALSKCNTVMRDWQWSTVDGVRRIIMPGNEEGSR